jgi:transcriptional regulator with GAF, ATPase, and Fis domain
MVARKEFRSDLYYRLNVFPIVLPPLRERREDIPKLTSHFVEVFARRMSKRIDPIPQDILDAFSSYSWPGKVRELQNLIERAMI